MSPAGGRLVTGLGITLAVVFAVSAIAQLLPAFVVLATGGADVAGIDLMSRLREARALFAGASPYALPAVYAPYPPATYLFFGPLAALTDQDARVLWALTTIPLLLALGWFAAVRAPGGMAMRVAALMLPFGFSGVAYGVQQGQLHVHALAAVVGALALIGGIVLFVVKPRSA